MNIAKNKICVLINKEWDESGGKRGVRKEFDSMVSAEKYLIGNDQVPGRLIFTKVQTWRKWDTIKEEDFLNYGYGRGSRVALYTNSGWRIETFKEGDTIVNTFDEIVAIRERNKEKPLDLSDLRKRKTIDEQEEKEKEDQKWCDLIAHSYADIYYRKQRVRKKDLTKQGFKQSEIRRLFGSLDDLDVYARERHPSKFKDIKVNDLYTEEYMDDFHDLIESGEIKRFVITTAVTSCDVDTNLLASIRTYCRENNAAMLVMMSTDPAAKVNKYKQKIDKVLKDELIIFEETALNSNLSLCAMKTSAKMINPTYGVKRLVHTKGSIIVSSPKQKLDVIPTGNKTFPHVEMTTGAITKPNYDTDRHTSERTAYLAEFDHVMGGLIVEIVNDKIFHYRQFQADKSGRFADLGVRYTPHGTEEYRPAAFVLGDVHIGDTDPIAMNCWEEINDICRPKVAVIHDLFNGKSIRHWDRKRKIRRARIIGGIEDSAPLSLQKELTQTAESLNDLCETYEEVVIVKSNHDEWLDRYLEDGHFMDEPYNYYFSLVLAKAVFEGEDPLMYGLEYCGFKYPERVRWLSRDENYTINKVQLGSHGDKGNNGSRGNIASMEIAFGNSVTGHTHTPGILRGAWIVGTSTFLKLDYTEGASSWMQTSCLVYPNGTRQLINVVNGSWRLE